MTITRRSATAALAALAALPLASRAAPDRKETTPMYGLIGKMRAQPGQRDALIAILLEGTTAMPGCLSYGIAKDKLEADALWITETWVDQAS
ncbi:MAG: antibiotic biosynthesis monooxygenase, partial [Lysobacteraceae bacterium]